MSGGHGHDDHGHGHDDHGHGHGSGGGGKGIDIGVASMIGSFFGLASGAWAMKEYMDWGGGWHGHDHH